MNNTPSDLLEIGFEPARDLEPTDGEITAILARFDGRRQRRRRWRSLALGAAGAILLTAAAGAATGVFPIGTELPTQTVPGKGEPHYISKRVVLATGATPVAGGWQATVTQSDQGLCFGLELVDIEPGTLSEGCGGASERFDATSLGGGSSLPDTTLVYGPAPKDAVAVRASGPNGFRQEVETHEGPGALSSDFYVMEIPREIRDVEIAWLDRDGRTQGPGIFVPSTVMYDGKAADPQLPH